MSQTQSSALPLLEEIIQFIQKFIPPVGEIEMVSWFESVLDDFISDLQTFRLMNNEVVALGSPSLISDQNCFREYHDIGEDLELLFEDISAFQRAQRNAGHSNSRLTQLQTRCLNFLTQSDLTKESLSHLQNQIKEVVVRSQVPINYDEIRSQFTQINRSLEDFLSMSHHLIPQHERIMNELNDSFVESLRETFATEFNQLGETIGRFSQTDDDLRQILERMEFSKKEEVIRQDRLSRLKKFTSQFTVDEDSFLGRGSFAEVKCGRLDGRAVAIKMIQARGSSFNATIKTAIENEVLLMSMCHHPCVLQIYGFCEIDPRTTSLILELGSMGSLWSLLENKTEFPSFTLSQSIDWMIDILSGLCYLHQHRIVHRNVKAENVLVFDSFHCKLTDFGLSKQQMESSLGFRSPNTAGTLSFMAPESLPPTSQYSHRSDVYSFGVACYQIISRLPPVPHTSSSDTMIRLLRSTIDLKSWDDFVVGCLARDSNQRLSAREASNLILEVKTKICHLTRLVIRFLLFLAHSPFCRIPILPYS
jgi:hypothetical protein